MRLLAFLTVLLPSLAAAQTSRPIAPADNLIVVSIDGLRHQEVFRGADPAVLNSPAEAKRSSAALRALFLEGDDAARREKLMPFLWRTVVPAGQIFGDRKLNSDAHVANPHHISYPGYSEFLCGFVEPTIDSNRNLLNPNPTVLEWLNGKPEFAGKIAAFGAWDRLRAIVNPARSHIYTVAGFDLITPLDGKPLTERQLLCNEMQQNVTHFWPDECFDVTTEQAALEHLKIHRPRVLYVMLGEPDEWAHASRYDLYLQSIQRSDAFIRRLWETAQADPQYKGKTALLLTCDHGRGNTVDDWTSHGSDVKLSEQTWHAVMSPELAPQGERHDTTTTQSQVAATIAALLGQDYHAAVPRSAGPLPITRE